MQQTVMIVDDSIPVHMLMKKQLEPEHLSIHSFYDGMTAVSAAVSLVPDLILLDVDLPGADGFQACQFLKSNPLTAAIPLIFVSGDSLVADKVKGLDLGAVDYIVKPFKSDELRARVRSALRTRPVGAEGQMAGGLRGVWTQPYFELQLKSMLSLAQRAARPLSCVVADFDHWGTIHSRLGQQATREIIRGVARAFVLRCRSEDAIFQFDAGRFTLLLGDTGRYPAAKMIERLRGDIQEQFASIQEASLPVTYHFGISDTVMSPGETLFKRAEIAARRAKRRGGNCVAVARDSHANAQAA